MHVDNVQRRTQQPAARSVYVGKPECFSSGACIHAVRMPWLPAVAVLSLGQPFLGSTVQGVFNSRVVLRSG
jgi:hypothetical protein